MPVFKGHPGTQRARTNRRVPQFGRPVKPGFEPTKSVVNGTLPPVRVDRWGVVDQASLVMERQLVKTDEGDIDEH